MPTTLPPEQVIPNAQQQNPHQPRLITKSEFARLAGVDPVTIDRWVAADLCPKPIRIGSRGFTRWSIDDVNQWLANLTAKRGEAKR